MTAVSESGILFYFGVFSPVGGIEQFAVNLLSGFATQGVGSSLVCSAKQSWVPRDCRFRLVRIPYIPGSDLKVSDHLLLLTKGLVEARRASSIVFGKHPPGAILGVLRRFARAKTKFVFVTPYAPEPARNEHERQAMVRAHRHYDLVIVQAESFKRTLRESGVTCPIEVLPYPLHEEISLSKVSPFPAAPPFRIGFLGRLEPQKDLDLLFEAFAAINDQNVELHIYGSGSEETRLHALASEPRYRGGITFHGSVPRHAVAGAIADNHLFAFSSHTEGQVLAALEILACGRPIAAVPVGALQELLAEPLLGACTSSRDASELAETIASCIQTIKEARTNPDSIRKRFDERWNQTTLISQYARLLKVSAPSESPAS